MFFPSLFLERRLWSKKLTAPKRGESGMVELCREAYVLYQDEVVKQKWIYARYVEDFLSGHECCDALDATSINENARSLRTMKTLLWRRKDLVLRYFGMGTLTDEQIKEMIYLLNTTNSSGNDYSTSSQLSQHSLLSCLDAHDYELIADCCNHLRIFRESVNPEILLSLFDGTLESPIVAENNRMLAFLFHSLKQRGLVCDNWQMVIARQGMIHSRDGNPLNQKKLSAALYQVQCRNYNELPSPYKVVIDVLDRVSLQNSTKRNHFK